MALPEFIPPMLCKIGESFSSEDHLFEIKWDGTRALTFVEGGQHRMLNRHQRVLTGRYPDLAFLADIPDGCILDGELVVMRDGKPDFSAIMSREHTRSEANIALKARTTPATYVVFDLLYQDGVSILDLPLLERRERLAKLVDSVGQTYFVQSDGIVGDGEAFFEAACAQELEGIVAKRADGRYLPGQRTESWQKIKRSQTVLCVIIGYVAAGPGDVRSLILAIEEQGELRCVGKVGSGLTEATRQRLWKLLSSRQRSSPLVRCRHKGTWVEPGVYCAVSFLERTNHGELRTPVFKELIVE